MEAIAMKDWLGFEQHRNKKHADLYTSIIRAAVSAIAGVPKEQVQVLIGHHLTFELGGDISTENEIPSADCLMFDHVLMSAAFGEDKAKELMAELALLVCEERDDYLRAAWVDHTGMTVFA